MFLVQHCFCMRMPTVWMYKAFVKAYSTISGFHFLLKRHAYSKDMHMFGMIFFGMKSHAEVFHSILILPSRHFVPMHPQVSWFEVVCLSFNRNPAVNHLLVAEELQSCMYARH